MTNSRYARIADDARFASRTEARAAYTGHLERRLAANGVATGKLRRKCRHRPKRNALRRQKVLAGAPRHDAMMHQAIASGTRGRSDRSVCYKVFRHASEPAGPCRGDATSSVPWTVSLAVYAVGTGASAMPSVAVRRPVPAAMVRVDEPRRRPHSTTSPRRSRHTIARR